MSNTDVLSASVIIPTHNRCDSLERTLNALQAQTYPFSQMEVIVVADSCTDTTLEMLHDYKAPFELRVLEHQCRSAAIARNYGTTHAHGQLLIFIDDDVEPISTLIENHVLTHNHQSGCVAIGPYPPISQGTTSFFHVEARAWWHSKFQAMRSPGHRYNYQDVLSGNLSIAADLFSRIGGFDSVFKDCGGEDYELGVRLVKAGIPLVFAADALAYHHEHETNNLDRLLRRMRQEGRSDVLMGQRYPELRNTMRLAYFAEPFLLLDRILVSLIFLYPQLSDRLASGIRQVLDFLEWMRMRGTWRWLCMKLRGYWYLRGVADELVTHRSLVRFLQGTPTLADQNNFEIEIDLGEGLVAAEHRLEQERPAGAYIRYKNQFIGHIPPQVGAEQLRGVHLRPFLATQLAWPLIRALAVETAISPPLQVTDVDRGLPSCPATVTKLSDDGVSQVSVVAGNS